MKTDGIFLQSGLLLLSLTFYKRLSPLPNSFLTSTKAESKQPTENEHCLFRRLPNKPSELRISSVELDSYKAHLPSLKPFFIILFFFPLNNIHLGKSPLAWLVFSTVGKETAVLTFLSKEDLGNSTKNTASRRSTLCSVSMCHFN